MWVVARIRGQGSSTSNFISNLFKSLPPLQDISDMAGFELPEYLGKVTGENGLLADVVADVVVEAEPIEADDETLQEPDALEVAEEDVIDEPGEG